MKSLLSTRLYGQYFAIMTCVVTVELLSGPAAAQNPIVVENQNAGSTAWQIPWSQRGSDVPGQIKGYANATSINKGQTITFFVSVDTAKTYTIDVYRMGYYQGRGGRLMQHIGPLNGIHQAACPTDATTGMIACNWTASYTLATQASWTSGVYLALLTNASGFMNYIVFVVRDDSRQAALLYQQPVSTYQAYNDYPYDSATGKSLYFSNSFGANTISGNKNAVKVSFDRPYNGNGDGDTWSQGFLSFEVSFVRWMESSGYDVTYATDVDVHVNPNMLLNYKGIVSVGHDEYWTLERFNAFTAARDRGVNIAFFGADTLDWQMRYEPSASGVANRVVVCYRNASLDPNPNAATKTVEWINSPVNRAGQTLTGSEYVALVYPTSVNQGYAPFVVQNSSHWIYAGSGFKNGDSVPGIVGYETDAFQSQYGTPGVAGTFTLLSSSPFKTNGSAQAIANAVAYQAASGAWVFTAGTMGWAQYGLDNYWGYNLVDGRLQKSAANILNRFTVGSVASDFSLTATPSSQNTTAGGAVSYTISVVPANGFTGSVALSLTGLPTGATASFSLATTSSTSTLTVNTTTTTPAGTFALTVTGISGTLTHTAPLSINVGAVQSGVVFDNQVSSGVQWGVTSITTPPFTIGGGTNRAAMIMVAMTSNTAATVTARIGSVAGTLVSGTDTLSTAAFRTMIFQVINPPSGLQTATVSWSNAANADVGVITVSGADQTTPVNNGVSTAANISPGVTTSVIVNSNPGDLSASVGYTTDAWMSPFTNQTLRWGLDSAVIGGDTGAGSGTTTHTWMGSFAGEGRAVSAANFKAAGGQTADFGVSASPASQTISPGGSTSYTTTITPSGGFTGSVALTVSGLPSGATASFTPNPATTTSTLSITTASTTTAGNYALTITGVSGALTHTAPATLVVNAGPDFTLSASPTSQTVTQGGSTTFTTTITPSGGFAGSVALSASGLPTGATASFTPNPATTTSTLSITTPSTTTAGNYALTITGVSGALTHTAPATLVVNASSGSRVVFDNKVSSDFQWGVTSITTPAFVIGNGANRAAMIMVVMDANNAATVTASLGGVQGTLVTGTDTGATAAWRTMIFQVINPPSGAQTAQVSWTNALDADIAVVTVSGASQTAPVNNGVFTATNSAASNTTPLTINSSPGDLTASVAFTSNTWASPFTNQNLKWGLDSGVAAGDVGAGAGTTIHTWTGQFVGESHVISGANFAAGP